MLLWSDWKNRNAACTEEEHVDGRNAWLHLAMALVGSRIYGCDSTRLEYCLEIKCRNYQRHLDLALQKQGQWKIMDEDSTAENRFAAVDNLARLGGDWLVIVFPLPR